MAKDNMSIMIDSASLKSAWEWKYYPEIDGLRTLAVLSVIAFHLFRDVVRGGFIGVDVFFVISGYLITSVLLQDIDRHHFSILSFYQRRVARIAPALFFILVLTLASAAVLYSAQDFASVAASAAAAAISAINVKLLFQGSYFQISPDAQPLLHYWSLAVEEQFYLVFPLLLYVVMRYIRRRVVVVVSLCAVSFACCVALTAHKPVFAFYMLPTRAWELLAGCGLALFRYEGGTIKPALAPILGWFGMGALLLSVLLVRETGAFPGWIAAVPVAASVMILGSIGHTKGVISKALAHPAMTFIGKRSYSLYLWHWPVFSFVDYTLFRSQFGFRLFLKLLLSVVCTLLTYEALERPARQYLNRPSRRIVGFAGFGALAIAVVLLGAFLRQGDYLSAVPSSIASGGIVTNKRAKQNVVLIGDSQGAMYGRELATISREMGFRLNVLSVAGGNELAGESNSLWPEVKQFLARKPADVIIVAEAWSSKLGQDPVALQRAIEALDPFGRRIVIVDQPPLAPPAASREAIRDGSTPPFYEEVNDRTSRLRSSLAVSKLETCRVHVVHVDDLFFRGDGSLRVIGEDGRLNFMNSDHLSDTGTRLVHARLASTLAANLRQSVNSD